MRVDPPFNVYRECLSSLYHGVALWSPNPVESIYNQVSIGDVGYLDGGAFIRMFNVTRPWDDESNRKFGEPDYYEPLIFDKHTIRRTTVDSVDYFSASVSKEENAENTRAATFEE
jgi:hypothetical protein